MSLSVCCLTNGPGARVRAVLEDLRSVADEIVVAVDARLDPDLLGHYAAVADKLVRFEFAPPIDRLYAWLHAQCSGDWILKIDSDELLSSALLERLPALTADRVLTQYWLPCHWLFPDAATWLAEPPWLFDTPRLVRNDPARLWFPGLSHSVVEPLFPRAHLEDGFYHLYPLVTTADERRERSEYYLGLGPGLDFHSADVVQRDVPLFYQPERAVSPHLERVPEVDRARIERVLAIDADEIPGPAGIPLASRAEIDAHWSALPFGDGAYHGRITCESTDLRFVAGVTRQLVLRVTNLGDRSWPGERRSPLVRLGHRWLDAAGERLAGADGRTELPAALASGRSQIVPVVLDAPAEPGTYLVELDLVHEDVRWFNRPVRVEVEVG